ncbi:MAG: type II secretion system protein [Phycisphaerae bacterium]|jgi:prepilin-type N-terminal cleavage/methylation domain-containing protein
MSAGSLEKHAPRRPRAFTLVELLVVIAIIVVLLAILLPTLRSARVAARRVKAHADLRNIDLGLELYLHNNADHLPPSRFSCSMRNAYDMPVELAQQHYLPGQRSLVAGPTGEESFIDVVQMYDVFQPRQTYKYRAPGAAIVNETTLLEPPHGANLWVPQDFPDCAGDEGRYWTDPLETPVRYAIWSVGPDPDSPKFQYIGGHMPLPARYWCRGATDTGVITHFLAQDGKFHMSP